MAAINPGPANTERMYKFVRPEINANKFWAISWAPAPNGEFCVSVRWGRIGTSGQATSKVVERYGLTQLYTQLIRSKLAHGYIEVTAGETRMGFSNKARAAGAVVRDTPTVEDVVLGTARRKVDLSDD